MWWQKKIFAKEYQKSKQEKSSMLFLREIFYCEARVGGESLTNRNPTKYGVDLTDRSLYLARERRHLYHGIDPTDKAKETGILPRSPLEAELLYL